MYLCGVKVEQQNELTKLFFNLDAESSQEVVLVRIIHTQKAKKNAKKQVAKNTVRGVFREITI